MSHPLRRCSHASGAFWNEQGASTFLINNAGYLQSGAVEEVTVEQALAQFDTNY
jgi:NAD(P)-dependent dehydrogenase (short-subunit alcohol dehydrogenase family)